MRSCISTLLLLTLFGALSLIALPQDVSAQPQRTAPIVLVDDLHRRVLLRQPAKRIVSLAPFATEMLLGLHLRRQIVGVDSESRTDLPPSYLQASRALPVVGDLVHGWNIARILHTRPDLVLALPGTPDLTAFTHAHVPVVFLAPENLAGVEYDLLLVGKAAGVPQRALSLVATMRRAIRRVAHAVAGRPRPTVFYEIDPSLYTAGPKSLMDQVIHLAGGRDAMDRFLKVPFARVPSGLVRQADPDYILLGDAPTVTPASVAARPGWADLRAVRWHHIISDIDPAYFQEPGPAIVIGIRLLAARLHPDLGRRTR